ncbi:MAG: hypothetical protein COA52_01315 [Hyphomicrobiales bacterium]|nr:MAG: hypothetical protein COA52_00225 [Hyphomicrobiales bacterium]PCJ96871.1 MAG: hypothetical protein COA52_01315 [Hyphomicrobiales bacterium]
MKFPYTLSDRQQKAADEIIKYFEDGEKHVILDAPTGTGKSIIALYITHRILESTSNKIIPTKDKKNKNKISLITKTINLQKQYMAEKIKIDNLYGKSNYECNVTGDFSVKYNDQTCFMKKNNSCRYNCKYQIARSAWMKSNLRLTNFAFMVEACGMICNLPGSNRSNVMIIDECHLLPEELLERSLISFEPSMAKYSRKIKEEIDDHMSFINEMIDNNSNNDIYSPNNSDRNLLLKEKDYFENLREYFMDAAKKVANGRKMSTLPDKDKKTIKSLIEATGEAGELGDQCEMLAESRINSKFVLENNKLKAIFPGDIAQFGIFRKSDHFLHMTATLCGLEQYKKDLDLDDVKLVTLTSDFPIENRQIYFCNQQKTDSVTPKLTKNIDAIIGEHIGERGIIHTVSYTRAYDLVKQSKHARRMIIPKNRIDIESYINNPPKNDSILVSPSLSTGYDFKNELARFQLILKMPYKPVQSKWMKAILKYNKEFYFNGTLKETIQMCGRGVRNKEDHCDTYILDSRFNGMIWYQKKQIPEWFLDAVQIIE